jgi:hypothetical protein
MRKGKSILAWLLCISMAANSGMTALAADVPAEDSQMIELTGDDLQDFLDSLEEGESSEVDLEDREDLTEEDASADEEEADAGEEADTEEEADEEVSDDDSTREDMSGEKNAAAGKQEDEAASDADEKISGAEDSEDSGSENTGNGANEDSESESTGNGANEDSGSENAGNGAIEVSGSASIGDASADESDEDKETVDDEILADEDLIFDLATASDAVLDVDLLPEVDLIDIELASASNASYAEIAPIALRYEIYADEDTQLQKDDLTGTSKKLYEALEDCLKEMAETQSLIIKISLGELGTFRSECDEDGSYDEDEAILAAEEIGAEWKDALQEAYDVFSSEYGEYLWFDHLVLMLDADGTYEEEDDSIAWTVEGSTGLPTDLSFDEIEEKLNAILSAMASYGLIIYNGVLSGYTGSPTTITIPSTVTSIRNNAFDTCTTLKEVYIPGTVKSIGDYAFRGCTALRTVTLNEGTTSIGKYAFSECSSLSSMTIPATVTSGNLAFYNCTGLRSVIVKGTLDAKMFYKCEALRTVDLSTSISEIPEWAFRECTSLTSIALPDNLKTIGEYAFSDTALAEIEFPSKLRIIESDAFLGCDELEKVDLSKTQVTTIAPFAFFLCTGVTSINLPATVSDIGRFAFSDCKNLTSVNITSSKIELAQRVFGGCTSLRSVSLPGGTTLYTDNSSTVPGGQFFGCTALTKVTLGEGITEIPNGMFFGCDSLKTITLPSTVKSIEANAFYECSALTSITIPAAVRSVGSKAFYNCTSLTSVDIKSKTIKLCEYAFSGSKLGEITLPGGTTFDGQSQFSGCSALKKVTLGSGITKIPANMFWNCSSLSSLTIPSTVKTIGDFAFGRSGLSQFTIPDSVTSIGLAAFSGCASLKEISLPNSIKTLSSNIFGSCTNLTKVVIPASVTSIDANAFISSYKVTIYGYTGTTAETFAKENSIPFVDMSADVQNFVIRLYDKVLGRTPDKSGLAYWTNALINGEKTGATVAANVIFSAEYTKKNVSDTEFIQTLYRAMMGRDADNGGMLAWKERLDNGVSREYVFNNFVKSTEFQKICTNYGITRGSFTLKQYRDMNYKVTQFVNRCYTQALGRKGDGSGLNAWTSRLLNKKQTPKAVAKSFVFSGEATKKNLNNTEFVKMLYRLYMGREADNGGLKYWVGLLNKGTSRQKVANSMADSKEFTEIVKSYGL